MSSGVKGNYELGDLGNIFRPNEPFKQESVEVGIESANPQKVIRCGKIDEFRQTELSSETETLTD